MGHCFMPLSYHIDLKLMPPSRFPASSVCVAPLLNNDMRVDNDGANIANSQSWPNVWTSEKNDLSQDKPHTDCRWFCCQNNVQQISETDSLKKEKWKTWPIILSILAVSGFLTYLIDPTERIQAWAMEIGPDSMFLKTWQSPPITIYTKVYIFNFTNSDAFMAGIEPKLRLEEIGPFVFIESLNNTKIKFNGNGTMTYTPKRSVEFQRHLSVADPNELRVIVPNIAFLGLGSMLADSSMITNLGALSAIKYLGPKPFMNITVNEYLWGYKDPLVEIAHAIVSNWIPFTKLGILDRMYDEGENDITIRLEDNGLEVTDPGYLPKYSIDSWNGSPGLPNWGYYPDDYYDREEPLRPDKTEKCRLIKGATEGSLFPRKLNPEVTNYVFRKTFCRHMPIVFKEKGSYMPGIPVNWYGLADDVFETPDVNPEQLCYCDPSYQTCVPKGLSDITPCYYNIPAAVSFPHFYNADPKLIQDIDGLSPNKEKHGSFALIQPDLGSIIGFQTRIQTNLIMKNIKYNGDLIPLANLHIPLFWVEMEMDDLPINMVISIYMLLIVNPVIQIVSIIMGIISAVLLLLGFLRHIFTRRSQREIVIETMGIQFPPQKIEN